MSSQHREDLPFKAVVAGTDYVVIQEADAKNARRYYALTSALSGSSMSAADILAALLTVDGAGSGLDADLLDGQSSAAFELTGVAAALVDDLSGVTNAATARTNLGVGTEDSPQFTAVNVGHASDTTITRVSAGVIAVEGVQVATQAEAKAEHWGIAVGDNTTALTVGTGKESFRMPFAATLTGVRASLITASSSGIPTINIKESGVTIFSTKLTIDANELTSVTAATPAVISDAALADDAIITIDIDVAGTGAAGLKIIFYWTRA